LAGVEKSSDANALDIVGNAVEGREHRGEAQIARRVVDSRLGLFHGRLLIDRQVRIVAELGPRRRGIAFQACQIGLRRLQVAYRGIERGPRRGTRIEKMLLALVVGLRIVDARLGFVDLLEARAIGLDQVANLVMCNTELRFGIGQRDLTWPETCGLIETFTA
jgi:hypothetical protein